MGPLSDLDDNVSEEGADCTKKNEKNDDEFEQYPRKDVEFDENMDIDVSDGDNEESAPEQDNGGDDGDFDPKSLEEELTEKDAEREREKLEDLERGSSEIMPPNEPKDEELDCLNEN